MLLSAFIPNLIEDYNNNNLTHVYIGLNIHAYSYKLGAIVEQGSSFRVR